MALEAESAAIRREQNTSTMAANERPVYGPAPPPDSFDTTSPLLLYTSHRSKRASVFKRAAIASKRKVRMKHLSRHELVGIAAELFVFHLAYPLFV
jgi:hypothetical protein